MKTLLVLTGINLLCVAVLAGAQGKGTAEQGGSLLYSTYCIGCHTTEVHWREKRLAKDWITLKAEVRRSKANTGVGLGEDDVAAIARYLNDLYYHFPVTDPVQSG